MVILVIFCQDIFVNIFKCSAPFCVVGYINEDTALSSLSNFIGKRIVHYRSNNKCLFT